MDEHLKNAIIIDRWTTECGNCKAKATPTDVACGGCGTTFQAVTTRYIGLDKSVALIRPDLDAVPYQRKENDHG